MEHLNECEQKIHLADGDNKAAAKIITEVRRSPMVETEHKSDPVHIPTGYLIGACIVVLALVVILFII